MRRAIQSLYSLILRVIGLFGLAYTCLFFLFLGGWEAQNMGHPVPVVFMSLFILFSLVLTIGRRWLPALVATPRRPRSLLAILPGGLVLAGVFVLGTMASVVVIELDEPQSRSVAVGSAIAAWMLVSLAGLLGTILSLWAPPDEPPPPRKAAQGPVARLHDA
jgi:hypothetical protein